MRLPSKIKSKYIAAGILFIFLLIFPFKNFIENIFIFFSSELRLSPHQNYARIIELQKRNLSLVIKIRQLHYLGNENEKLKAALEFKKQRNIEVVGVEIISFDPSSWRRLAIVNAGKDKGLQKGSYVINENGYLLGKISEVKKTYSYLMLIDDPDFSLPVFIGENSTGMLKGTLGGVDIFYIEETDNIKVKDRIWIKIPNTTFPIYIGEVRKVKKDSNSLFLGINVELFVRNPFLHKIFVVR
ncbi:MAG: rod shape-determining protein MreC [Candidatus Omnitrophota bacterium]|nr:rod shape-determining protein MreC [Candidatus Omnitrophota bacterium]